MTAGEPSPIVLHADQEHGGVRFAVLSFLLVAFAIAFLILQSVFRSFSSSGVGDFAFMLACLGALPVALGLAALGERTLKRKWPSGKSLQLDQRGVEVRLPEDGRLFIEWSKRFWPTKWYFSLRGYPRGGRERRVPAGWYCLACQLQQDELRLVVFSYLPENKAKVLAAKESFYQIHPSANYEINPLRRRLGQPYRPTLAADLLTGKEGPFWLAERRRWSEGLELTPEDFSVFMTVVKDHFEE